MRNFNYRKFAKKYCIKLAGKVLDIVILIAVGSLLGLHLVRY